MSVKGGVQICIHESLAGENNKDPRSNYEPGFSRKDLLYLILIATLNSAHGRTVTVLHMHNAREEFGSHVVYPTICKTKNLPTFHYYFSVTCCKTIITSFYFVDDGNVWGASISERIEEISLNYAPKCLTLQATCYPIKYNPRTQVMQCNPSFRLSGYD